MSPQQAVATSIFLRHAGIEYPFKRLGMVDGHVNNGAAWHYATSRDAAKNVEEHIAFWKGVMVEAGR